MATARTRTLTTETATETAPAAVQLTPQDMRDLRLRLILEWDAQGYVQTEIAAALGTSQPEISRALKRFGYARSVKPARPPLPIWSEIVAQAKRKRTQLPS